METGLKSQYMNVINAFGGEPRDVVQRHWGPRSGQNVHLVPKKELIDGTNGSRIRNGRKPASEEVA